MVLAGPVVSARGPLCEDPAEAFTPCRLRRVGGLESGDQWAGPPRECCPFWFSELGSVERFHKNAALVAVLVVANSEIEQNSC